MTEPASVIAARQLAEEARSRGHRVRPARRVASAQRAGAGSGPAGRVVTAMLLAGVLSGCTAAEEGTACPAIGWLDGITVQLAADWPPVQGGSVRLECSTSCGPAVLIGQPERTTLHAPLSGTRADLIVGGSAPEAAVVTVLSADGQVQTEVDVELHWVRVGGSAECGGPRSATVTVPAP